MRSIITFLTRCCKKVSFLMQGIGGSSSLASSCCVQRLRMLLISFRLCWKKRDKLSKHLKSDQNPNLNGVFTDLSGVLFEYVGACGSKGGLGVGVIWRKVYGLAAGQPFFGTLPPALRVWRQRRSFHLRVTHESENPQNKVKVAPPRVLDTSTHSREGFKLLGDGLHFCDIDMGVKVN